MFYNDPSQTGSQAGWYPQSRAPDQSVLPPTPVLSQPVPVSPWPSAYPLSTPLPQPSPARSGMRSGAIFALTVVVLLIFGVGLFSGWALSYSHPTSYSSLSTASTSTVASSTSTNTMLAETAQEAVIARVEPAVVEIEGSISQGETIGSGIIIDSKGDIVTNNHVVDGTSLLQVILSNGSTESAQIVGTDPAADLAVIRIQPFGGMVVATLGDSSKLAVGQEVLAIGNPLGYSETATEGVVSALNRDIAESNTVTLRGMIQTSAAINPGNSGGALIDLQSRVVGMPTLSAIDTETNTPANGLGFAIPSNQIKTVIAQILNS